MKPTELLDGISVINSKFSDAEWVKAQNGNVLSYTALKLAAMKAYLVDEKETAQKQMMRAEIEMETEKAKAYLKAKNEHNATAASDLKNMDPDYIKAKEKYANKKVYYDKLKSIVADSHDLIESIRSRVIDLQGARKDERVG
jgi:hypothetical protein